MTSERSYKTEVFYRGRSVFKAGYHDSAEEAARVARESLGLDGSVYEVRVLDGRGRVLDAYRKEER